MTKLSRWPALDVAAALTTASALLYLLGHVFWKAYYAEFGVDPSLLELGVQEMLATSSLWLLAVVFVAGMPWWFRLIDRDLGPVTFGDLLLPFVMVSLPLTVYYYVPRWWALLLALLAIVPLTAMLSRALGRFANERVTTCLKWSPRSGLTVVVCSLVVLLCVYQAMGRVLARSVMRGAASVQSDGMGMMIRLHVAQDMSLPQQAVLIGHMKDKYFIYGKIPGDQHPRTYIVSDSAVSAVEIMAVGRSSKPMSGQ